LKRTNFEVEVFWVVTPCTFVGYQRFGGSCSLRLQVKWLRQEEVSPKRILPQHYTASQPRRPRENLICNYKFVLGHDSTNFQFLMRTLIVYVLTESSSYL